MEKEIVLLVIIINELKPNEGQMGYRLGAHKGERNNLFSKIQLVGQKYQE